MELANLRGRMGGNGFTSLVFLSMFGAVFILPRITDILRYDGSPWLWIAASLAGIAAAYGVAFLTLALFLKRAIDKRPRPLTNLVVLVMMGATRGSVYGTTATYFGLMPHPDLWWRIPTSVLVTLMVGLLAFQIHGALGEHRGLTRGLIGKRDELVESKALLSETLAVEQKRLREESLSVIEPRFQRITALLDDPKGADSELAAELKGLVGTTLREHLASIWVEPLVSRKLKKPRMTLADFAVARTFRLRRQLEPVPIFLLVGLIAIPSFWRWSELLGLVMLGAVLGATVLAIKLVMLAIPKDFEILSWLGIPVVAVLPTVVLEVAAAFILPVLGPNDTGERGVANLVIVIPLLALSIASIRQLDYALNRYRKELTAENELLNDELAIVRRRLWLVRRNWHLKLHGEFQGALTAILARVSTRSLAEIDRDVLRRELNLALASIEGERDAPLSLRATVEQLRETWHDVVEINCTHSPQVAELLDSDDEARQCVSEMLRELVNNASKHGEATKVNIVIDRPHDRAVRIVASNNGLRVGPEHIGLGTKMYSEVCSSWSLENDEQTGEVVLTADIPLLPLGARLSR